MNTTRNAAPFTQSNAGTVEVHKSLACDSAMSKTAKRVRLERERERERERGREGERESRELRLCIMIIVTHRETEAKN
jgi:hypothetical protein